MSTGAPGRSPVPVMCWGFPLRDGISVRKMRESACKPAQNAQRPAIYINLRSRCSEIRDFSPLRPFPTANPCVSSPPMSATPQSPPKHRAGGLAPERSLTQRMDALKRANEVRTRRARLKRDLKAGRTQIHGLLLDPPDYLQTQKGFELLLAVPKYGRVKANRVLTHCRISPSKTIGGLSQRQRDELVSYLRR